MTDIQSFGQQIRAAREARGMTQTEAARRVGISNAYLCQIELGREKNPTVAVANSLKELFMGSEENKKEPDDGLERIYVQTEFAGELSAMDDIHMILDDLTPAARRRVLAWAQSVYADMTDKIPNTER